MTTFVDRLRYSIVRVGYSGFLRRLCYRPDIERLLSANVEHSWIALQDAKIEFFSIAGNGYMKAQVAAISYKSALTGYFEASFELDSFLRHRIIPERLSKR